MRNLEVIKNYLDEEGIKSHIETLSNSASVLIVNCKEEVFEWNIHVSEPVEGGKEVTLYAVVSITCKEARYNVYRIINGYNKKYNYVKFFYQESEQGELVLASYSIPPLDSGLSFFFGKVLKKFVSILDDVALSIPTPVFKGEVKSYFSENN